jgi:hypothetical protein
MNTSRVILGMITMVLAQQRYVKFHRILANCLAVKDFRRFRNSQTGLGLLGQFSGLDSDRILKLILREIILSQEIQMPPGGRRPMGHRLQQFLPFGRIIEASSN